MSDNKIIKLVKDKIDTPTWKIHGVIDNPDANGRVYHTHGMGMYDSLELELNLPLSLEDAMPILNAIGMKIANGKVLKENELINGILMCPFIVKKVKGICKRDVDILRVIVPDEKGNFPWDEECEDIYNKQLG
ncbi:UNVERIFIED_ORG: hypothetical protein B2H93_04625 [Clostridium botulinum]